MCGIAGIINHSGAEKDLGQVRNMVAMMAHRGPDSEGVDAGEGYALGHRRLSIIDVSERGRQPMADHSGRFSIIFNGEIFNFADIRPKLNYPFSSQTDTETVLAAFIEWGPDCLQHFNGMFALAIHDKNDNSLFIARDRLGIKPLYFHQNEGLLSFASEIRPLVNLPWVNAKLDHASLRCYLTYQTTYNDSTMISGIEMLPAGKYAWFRNGKMEIRSFWDPVRNAVNHSPEKSPEQHKKEIRELLQSAVERRMISDVPLGAFLSGGIDSSAVVALMSTVSDRPVDTFSVVFNEKEFDESDWSGMIAKKYGTKHHPILLKPSDFLDELPNALKAMDHPSGDGINSYVVSKVTKAQGITVALSGLGGDELFGGYPVFTQLPDIQNRKMLWALPGPFRALAGKMYAMTKSPRQASKIHDLFRLKSPEMPEVYSIFRTIYNWEQSGQLSRAAGAQPVLEMIKKFGKDFQKLPLMSQISVADISSYTRNVLLRDTDQMSMAHSLEVRVPFFDHTLVEYVLGINDQVKYPHYPKKLLAEALGELLPDEIVHRKKMGFVFPWEHWLRNELKGFCEERIKSLSERGIVDGGMLMKIGREFQENKGPWLWTHIWLPVVLEEWIRNNDIGS